MVTVREKFLRRQRRVRSKLKRTNSGEKRLSVFRSNANIYVQVIDDSKRATLAAASTLDKGIREKLKAGGNIEAAKKVGTLIAERALKAGVKKVCFDRGGYLYHGRIKALAEAAREAGLKF